MARFEADLVVALAAVADESTVLFLGDGDLAASYDGTGKGGSEEVDVLVDLRKGFS